MSRFEISLFNTPRIITFNEAGFSDHHILLTLNIPRATLVRTIHRCEETETVERMPSSGRSRISTETWDRYPAQFTHRNRNTRALVSTAHFQGKFCH